MWKVANVFKNGGRSTILRNCPGQSTVTTDAANERSNNIPPDSLTSRRFSNSHVTCDESAEHKYDTRAQGPSSSNTNSNDSSRQEDGDECKNREYNFKDWQTDSRWLFNSFLFGLPAAFLSTTLQFHNLGCPYVKGHSPVKHQVGWFSHLSLLSRVLFAPKVACGVLPLPNGAPRAISYVPSGNTLQHASNNDAASRLDSSEFDEFMKKKQSVVTKATDHLENANRFLIGSFENMVGLDLLSHGLRTEAFQHFVRSSELDHPIGSFNLGMCYYKGYGTRPSDSKAVNAWQKSADLGNSSAKYQIGVSHIRGFGGLPVDRMLAQKYISDAAKDNLPEAQNFIGSYHYKNGEIESGRKFYEAAAATGNKIALAILSKVYKTPQATDKNGISSSSATLKSNKQTNNLESKQCAKFWTGASDDDDSDSDVTNRRFRSIKKSYSDSDSDSQQCRFDDSAGSSSSSVVFFDETTTTKKKLADKKSSTVEAENGKLKNSYPNDNNTTKNMTLNSLKKFLEDLIVENPGSNSVKKAHSVADFRDKNVEI